MTTSRVTIIPLACGDGLVLVPNDLPGLPEWFKDKAAYTLRIEEGGIVVEHAWEDDD